jgi:hypothetical protein
MLQEWCYSAQNGWYSGELNGMKIQPALNSSLAAAQWEENGVTQLRVYYQGSFK